MTTTVFEDPQDRRLALRAEGVLAQFNRAGVLDAADVHAASRLGSIIEEDDESVLLAAALAVRATREGAVCVDLAAVADGSRDVLPEASELTWPEPEGWIQQIAGSVLVRDQALRLEGSPLCQDRHWLAERPICDAVVARVRRHRPWLDHARLPPGLDRV